MTENRTKKRRSDGRRRAWSLALLFLLSLFPLHGAAQILQEAKLTYVNGTKGVNSQEEPANLFDGNTETKWCSVRSYSRDSFFVEFKTDERVSVGGYSITTANDTQSNSGRNPKHWKLLGSNDGENWTLIDEVSDDSVLQARNFEKYEFRCSLSPFYQYFRWVILSLQSGNTLQASEFGLKVNTCTHVKADGSSALGEEKTVAATCLEKQHTERVCSLCGGVVKANYEGELGTHRLTAILQVEASCEKEGMKAYRQCEVCRKIFEDDAATKEVENRDSLVIKAMGHEIDSSTGACTRCKEKIITLGGVQASMAGNDYPWFVSTTEGRTPGLMSSNKGLPSTTSLSTLQLTATQPFLLSFDYAVSSEKGNDVLTLTVDGKKYTSLSGTESGRYGMLLSGGSHEVVFSYKKDVTVDWDDDRAYVYNLKASTQYTDEDFPEMSYVVYDKEAGTLTFYHKKFNETPLKADDEKVLFLNITYEDPQWRSKEFRKVVFDNSFKAARPTTCYNWFDRTWLGISSIKTFEGMENLNTSMVTSMSGMFRGCSEVDTLDLSHMDFGSSRSFFQMFYGCTNLKTIYVGIFS